MAHRRADVVDTALTVLDRWGLADLSMRRLAGELGVQPSALYHHVASKQVLLAAVADEIVARGPAPAAASDWRELARNVAVALREAMLAWTDGAEVVATAHAFGLGARAAYADLRGALAAAGLPEEDEAAAARTLLLYVLGHVQAEQTHLQAVTAGALADDLPETSDFGMGLDLILTGIAESARLHT